METSITGIDLIKSFEGFRATPYICPGGKLTIGYGTTRGVRKSDVVSEEEAVKLLKKDLEIYEEAVNKYVEVELNQNMFDALVSFTYNLGGGNLKSSTLLKKLNTKDYFGASKEFERWNKAGGKVLKGLIRRRAAERDLFNSYPEK